MEKRRYKKEAFLSALVIGLGQISKGDSERGLRFILGFYLALPALLFTLLYLNAFLFLLLFVPCLIGYPLFWVYNIYDAAKENQR